MHDSSAFGHFRSDHADVLAHLDALDRVLLNRTAAPAPVPLDKSPIRDLVASLEAQFATHMRDEEELLFPALAESLPEASPGIGLLVREHDELRQMLASLAAELACTPSPARDEQVVVQLRDFVDLLRIHVHKEEATVFTIAVRSLPALEITSLSRRIADRHQRRESSPLRRKTC